MNKFTLRHWLNKHAKTDGDSGLYELHGAGLYAKSLNETIEKDATTTTIRTLLVDSNGGLHRCRREFVHASGEAYRLAVLIGLPVGLLGSLTAG